MTIAYDSGLAAYLGERRALIEAALAREVSVDHGPAHLMEAIRYSLLGGGKHLRAALVLAAAELCGGSRDTAVPAACAIEMVHTASLVHDDLPCMDDDDLRRGRATNHRVFGEALAILTGDALLVRAFELLSSLADDPSVGPQRAAALVLELAQALGARGVLGGQVLDLHYAGRQINPDALCEVHSRKTGALIRACLRIGALCADANPAQLAALSAYGTHVGLAFQIHDDVLGVIGQQERLGKPVGTDLRHGKATYVRVFGLDEARRRAVIEADAAVAAVKSFGAAADVLVQLARWAVRRES